MIDIIPTGLPRFSQQDIAVLLAAGWAAPSIHNTQPWRFSVRADQVEVRIERRRAVPVVDPDGRQQTISCGAAVFNLRLAVAHLGYAPVTAVFPDPDDPDYAAAVRAGKRQVPETWQAVLYQVLGRRHANRAWYRPVPVPPPVRARLFAAASAEGGRLYEVAAGQQRQSVAEVVLRGVRRQAGNPSISREFRDWVSDEPRPELGTPRASWLGAAYSPPPIVGSRDLDPGEAAELTHVVTHDAIYLLAGADDPAGWLQAGQALQRVWLTATAGGLAMSFLNQAIESPPLRAELARLVGSDQQPHMLLRVGYAAVPAPRTGRLGDAGLPGG